MKKILFIIFLLVVFAYTVFSEPLGATINTGGSTRRAAPNATNVTAQGGNVSWIEADLAQTTNVWQGFFGVVTGGILLEDGDGNTFYDWNVVDAVGEILAVRAPVTDWSAVNCTNQTEIYLEEERLLIDNVTSDGINDTFTLTNHPQIDIAGRIIDGCRSTQTYNSTGDSKFWNVLLNTDDSTTVYTSVLDNDEVGFNGTSVDFQLIVPVNKSDSLATYFIYVELD